MAYIKGRFVETNIKLIQDIFNLYNTKDKSGLLMFVDFKKAFHCVEWSFLFKVLEKFNFCPNFQHWIKLLYTNPCACVKNNGFISEEFSLYRGVRQGCPVSSLLFILCMEVMSSHIRQATNIKGLEIGHREHKIVKIVQYADDSTLFLSNSSDMRKAIQLLETFGQVAGTSLNLNKCEGLWLGSSKHRQNGCNLFNIKWPTDPIRCLGIHIGHDSNQCNKLNFENKVQEIEDILQQAKKRTITLFGKVCIIKTLAISKIIYVAMCLTVPDKAIKEINQMIFGYLWGKRDRIKRKSTVNTLEKGGLNMIDLKSQISTMRASWASRIVTAPADSLWSYLPKSYLSIFGDDYLILKTTIVNKTMFPSLKQIPEFYQDVVLSYNKSKIMSHEDFHNNIMNQPIWGNRFIKLKKETLLFKTWVSYGIIAMKNLKIDNGKLDVDYLYSVVTEKRELYREVHILQNALKQAKVTLSIDPTRDTNIPIHFHHTDEIYTWGPHKSKFYNNKLIEEVVIPPTSETYWQRATSLRAAKDVIHKSYIQKVKQLKDKKLAETNFKILNNILPCSKNLCKWGIGDTDLCCFCQEEENVSHLLYQCPHVKDIWEAVSAIMPGGQAISHDMVIFGLDLDIVLNHVLSIIVYFIYKEWLVCSFEKKHCKQNVCTKSLVNFLDYRKSIYSKCSNKIWTDICIKLDVLTAHLETTE